MFYRMYADDPDKWEVVTEAFMSFKLEAYYNNVPEVVQAIRDGQTVRTPFAFYKFIADEPNPAPVIPLPPAV